MALIFMFYTLILLLGLLLMVLEESSGRDAGEKCFYADAASLVDVKSRKVLAVLRADEPASNTGNGEKLEIRRELRAVPSGPDPLHHNGGSPKKPTTPWLQKLSFNSN
ncbi:hypothetical protein DKX38_013693 [Salix brachista]|uniref:CLAVATA3/ESR-like protein n=1 Tax=Salix brachista TaxID=2182728 RepID=A0A5N5LDB2_9ROSI|nr:hypothetical protein DKX38_013693 [Salix brachista]